MEDKFFEKKNEIRGKVLELKIIVEKLDALLRNIFRQEIEKGDNIPPEVVVGDFRDGVASISQTARSIFSRKEPFEVDLVEDIDLIMMFSNVGDDICDVEELEAIFQKFAENVETIEKEVKDHVAV